MEGRVGFGPRLAAVLIDLLFVGIAGFVAGAAIGGALGSWIGGALGESDGAGSASGGLGAAIGALFGAMAAFGGFAFFYSLIEAVTGASPGKMMLGLKVGTADGRPGSTALYVKRWVIKFSGTLLGVLGAVPGFHVIGLLAPAAGAIVFLGCFLVLGEKRQALHDIAAQTAVFRNRFLKTR